MITLTITTCKRFLLFEKTVNSFYENCLDRDLISHIIHYDDSSSDFERKEMFLLLKKLFPNVMLTSITFQSSDFKTTKRHLEIMKIWKTNNENFNFDYVFHLEDDWLFQKKFRLLEGIDLLKNHDDIALVGYSWEKKVFPPELFIPKIIGNFWEWYYSENHELNEPLFLDTVEMKYLPENVWVNVINWPYFGFRPSIHDVKKLKSFNNFNDEMDSFELEFAIRFAKKYKSFLHLERICYHIGDNISSYNLNNSKR
jgi:hypothetical protein